MREIGIRLALGSRQSRVVLDIAEPYLGAVLVGLAAGGAGSWYSTRLLSSVLYEVAPRDFLVLVGSGMTLLVVAVISSVVPAYRASCIDPVKTLKS